MVSQTTVRKNIARAVRTADLTTVSAKQIRRNVESELGLERDELTSLEWKAFVKTVIAETMATIERGEGEEESEENKARMQLHWGLANQ
jgi:phage terminase Nu1 subunit (DNA packaging protein)